MSKENQIGLSRKEFLKTLVKAGVCLTASTPLSIPLTLALSQEKKELSVGIPLESEKETQPLTVNPASPESLISRPETGIELLDSLGLRDKVVYLVYGRPQVHGVSMWGSLGMGDCCRTAEESWRLYRERKESISQEIGRDLEDFAYNLINPVYDNQGDLIRDIYIEKALELSGDQRLVALDFKDIGFARATLERFEKIFSKEKLAHLAITLDAEHFPYSQVDARAINQFADWFGQKHQEWAGGKPIPGLVFIYVFPGSRILNLGELKQYYLDQKTLVVPLFDGYGTKEGKEVGIGGVVGQLPNSEDFPALIGAMEFREAHENRFDQCTIRETYEALAGQPVIFFVSQ